MFLEMGGVRNKAVGVGFGGGSRERLDEEGEGELPVFFFFFFLVKTGHVCTTQHRKRVGCGSPAEVHGAGVRLKGKSIS